MAAASFFSRHRVDATKGPIMSALLRLSWPVLTSNMAMVTYQIANTVWLGRSGSDAVAAVAVGFPIMIFLWAIGDGIIFGGSALVAKYTGAGDHGRVNQVVGHVLGLVTAYYLLVAIFVIPLIYRLVVLMGTPAEIADDVTGFVRILLIGMPLTELFFAYSSMLQGTGDSVTPMKMSTAAMAMNMVLDPILILGLGTFGGFGVLGAAAGIIICRAFWAVAVIVFAARGSHGLRVGIADLRPDLELVRRLGRVSLPIAGDRLLQGAEQMVLVSIVAGFGSPVLAAYGVGQRILSLAAMPGFAMGTAVTALVGQNLGAGRVMRGEKSTWIASGLALVLLTTVGVVMAAFPAFWIGLFNSEPAVLSNGIAYLRVLGPTMGMLGGFFVFGGVYRALERTLPYFLLVLLTSWVVRIPLALLLPTFAGVSGVWFAMAAANTFGYLGAGLYLRYRCWAGLKEGQPEEIT